MAIIKHKKLSLSEVERGDFEDEVFSDSGEC
jgi:hypothetical protein